MLTGLPALLDGLLAIFRATTAKRKYFHLLDTLSRLGLIDIPDTMYDIIARDSLQGINVASHEVKVSCSVQQCHIPTLPFSARCCILGLCLDSSRSRLPQGRNVECAVTGWEQ